MQVLTTFLFTMATLLLLSTAVKASPVLNVGNDESSVEDLRQLRAHQNKEFKRICGLSFYCQRFTKRKRSWMPPPKELNAKDTALPPSK